MKGIKCSQVYNFASLVWQVTYVERVLLVPKLRCRAWSHIPIIFVDEMKSRHLEREVIMGSKQLNYLVNRVTLTPLPPDVFPEKVSQTKSLIQICNWKSTMFYGSCLANFMLMPRSLCHQLSLVYGRRCHDWHLCFDLYF